MTKALIRLFIRDAENTRDARVREQYGVLSGAVGIACNVFLFILKVVIGLVTGSISIAADAFNNLSDGLSCMISIVGFKVSGKAPDEKHPFGYGRTEYIAGLIVAFIVCAVYKRQLKSVRRATEAARYTVSGGAEITAREDRFTHTTEVRTPIKTESDDHDSGPSFSGGTTGDSGGCSLSGGQF